MKRSEIVWILIVSLAFGVCMGVLLHCIEPLPKPPVFDVEN